MAAKTGTYTLINSTTLSTSTSTVTFSSIPATYTDLVLVVSGRSTAPGAIQDGLAIRVNSDTGSNYSATYLRGDGTSALSGRNTNDTYYRLAANAMNGAGAAAGTFSATVVQFLDYSNNTTFKTLISRAGVAGGGTDAVVALWRNTSVINSVSCIGYAGNLDTGSTFKLYGIEAGNL
jgi:hypothetical protein